MLALKTDWTASVHSRLSMWRVGATSSSVHDPGNLTFLTFCGDQGEAAFVSFGMGEFYPFLLLLGQQLFLEI